MPYNTAGVKKSRGFVKSTAEKCVKFDVYFDQKGRSSELSSSGAPNWGAGAGWKEGC